MNMIEKVARAIATADEQNGAPPYDEVIRSKHSRSFLYDQARAAIDAMKEPTEEMIIDGTNARLNTGLSTYSETPEMWRAMISAALKE